MPEGVAKEIDHILVSTRWRILQNCGFSECRPITGLLLLHSSFISSPESFHDATTLCFILKLKDLTCAQEYSVTVYNWFGVLDILEYPEELWDTFTRETLEAAKKCVGKHPR